MVVVDVARRTVQEQPGNVSVSVSWGGAISFRARCLLPSLA